MSQENRAQLQAAEFRFNLESIVEEHIRRGTSIGTMIIELGQWEWYCRALLDEARLRQKAEAAAKTIIGAKEGDLSNLKINLPIKPTAN